MKLRSVGIWSSGLRVKYNCWSFGSPKNVSGWRYCSLFPPKSTYCKLTNPLNTALSKCCNLLTLNSRYSSLLKFPNVPGVISLNLLPHNDSFLKTVSPLNAPNTILLPPHHFAPADSSSVSPNNKVPLKQRYVVVIKIEMSDACETD